MEVDKVESEITNGICPMFLNEQNTNDVHIDPKSANDLESNSVLSAMNDLKFENSGLVTAPKESKNNQLEESYGVKLEEILDYNCGKVSAEGFGKFQVQEQSSIDTEIEKTIQKNETIDLDLPVSLEPAKANLRDSSVSMEIIGDASMEEKECIVINEDAKTTEAEETMPKTEILNLNSQSKRINGKNIEEISTEAPIVEREFRELIENGDSALNKNSKNCESTIEEIRLERSFPNSTEFSENNFMEDDIVVRNNKDVKKQQASGAMTSLALLASAYDNSDSDTDEVECVQEPNSNERKDLEMEVQIINKYRKNKPMLESSDSESEDSEEDSKSSLSSEDDSDDSAKEDKNSKKSEKSRYKERKEKEKKSELDDLPPIEELKISVPEVLCDPLGEVGWMVEQIVVVRPKPGKPTLNLDTILFVERGKRVLGRIFDVFGQVSEPHYCVRFNSTEHIKESDIKVGMIVYFCPNTEYTTVVFMHDLLKMKATDDVGDDEHPEFSDDEEERAYYAALRQKQKNDKTKTNDVPQKRQRTDSQDPARKSKHPWSKGKKPQQARPMGTVPDWSSNGQQNGADGSNSWQYPSPYTNPCPIQQNSYRPDSWQPRVPQNSYAYGHNRHSRPFFRPNHHFPPNPNSYMQNYGFPPQSPPIRHPMANFGWQGQVAPRQADMTWPLPPPPPPPGV